MAVLTVRMPDDRHSRLKNRLEYTQISSQEFSSVLDRIHEEIGSLRSPWWRASLRDAIAKANAPLPRTRSEMRAEFVVNARLESLAPETHTLHDHVH